MCVCVLAHSPSEPSTALFGPVFQAPIFHREVGWMESGHRTHSIYLFVTSLGSLGDGFFQGYCIFLIYKKISEDALRLMN